MAAAFYAIADLGPVRVFIAAGNPTRQRWELFENVNRAMSRIERLVTAAQNSPIGTQLLRILRTLGATRDGHRGGVGGAQRSCNFVKLTLTREQPLRYRRNTAKASGLATPFWTRLHAVSCLRFAPLIARGRLLA